MPLTSQMPYKRIHRPRTPFDKLCIDTIRTLAMDAVQKANSGHPGTPMALAPVAYTLWQQFLRYDPQDPAWPNRDRFVLSNGHASMLLYALLHLAGVKAKDGPAVSLDDIKQFRQLDSKCPGPSRIWHDWRRRDDHRPAGAGLRQQRRHGHGVALAGGALQSSRLRSSSTTTFTPCAATAT